MLLVYFRGSTSCRVRALAAAASAVLVVFVFVSGCASLSSSGKVSLYDRRYEGGEGSSGMEHRAPLARLSPEVSSKELEGIASWYGPDFHGRRTANGEIYNMYGMTAAHKTLPFDTMLRVTNLENGRSVVVRVNDRGPYAKGRIIDLSKSAAEKLQMIGPGTARVRLEVLYSEEP